MLKKQKILCLIHTPPPIHGSAVVGEMIKESTFLNEKLDCRYINLLVSDNLKETGKFSIKKLIRFIEIWFELLNALLKQKPNLCYFALTTTGIGFYKDIIFIFLLKIFNIKILYHLHNKGIKKYQDIGINKALYKYVFHNVEVILLSSFLYSDVSDFISMYKIHICPNGIDRVDNNVDTKSEKLNKVTEILFLSNLNESKGVFVLLKACQLILKRGILFHCTIVGGEGDISSNQLNQATKELELSGHISYLGKKYGEEKLIAYANADIFVFPTYFDCFPLVLLEAMQHSKPVISTFEGGIPDIVDDGITGFLIPQMDVKALADKLEILINNPELRLQMGAAGKEKFMREFTLENFETNLLNIINSVTTQALVKKKSKKIKNPKYMRLTQSH